MCAVLPGIVRTLMLFLLQRKWLKEVEAQFNLRMLSLALLHSVQPMTRLEVSVKGR